MDAEMLKEIQDQVSKCLNRGSSTVTLTTDAMVQLLQQVERDFVPAERYRELDSNKYLTISIHFRGRSAERRISHTELANPYTANSLVISKASSAFREVW